MIPIDIGPVTGTDFGSSDELSRIREISDANFRAYQSYHQSNPITQQNDSLFVRLVHIVNNYHKRGLNVESLIPNIAMHLDLVYRNYKQELHQTDWGKLLMVPVYDNSVDLFKVLYSNNVELNYNREALIQSHSFVTINIKLLLDLIKYYSKRGRTVSEMITTEIGIPLTKAITDYAMFNVITNIDELEKPEAPQHKFYMENLGKYIYDRRSQVKSAVTNLDLNPLDVLDNLPISTKVRYHLIEDDYIDNLLWINLMSYHAIVSNSAKINKENLYDKFYKSYSLYKPRGRGDKYFTNASSELLDLLEEVKFI